MNAYKLADELDKYKGIATRDAAKMLRQQQAEIENLKAGLLSHHDIYPPQTKPLSNEEIIKIWGVESIWDDKLIRFARAIEERHGIK